MIEVIPDGSRWTWRMICHHGRALVFAGQTYASDFEAIAAARAARGRFWDAAWPVDHRMGACL